MSTVSKNIILVILFGGFIVFGVIAWGQMKPYGYVSLALAILSFIWMQVMNKLK
jgi:hypothetical protein